MKFRKDFVTNSSSSSYVCEICGRTESGWDLGLSECEMIECVNGHVFCCDEALETPSKKEMIKMILENEWNKDVWTSRSDGYKDYTEDELLAMSEDDLFHDFCSESGYYDVPECVCPICQFIEYSEYDLSAYLLKEYGISRDEVFAEVKKLNKRRRKLYENEYITHVCKKFDLNSTEIVAGWKERFGTYSEFKQWLRG
jgi:AraC-like DNA-binding protein